MGKKDIDESEKSDKTGKALFVQRLMAFMIDMFLVSFVASFIVAPFVNNKDITKVQEDLMENLELYEKSEIDAQVFINDSIPLTYQLARKSGFITLITLFLEMVYFIVYQFYNGGKTIGKKIMRIKVISTYGELTMNQMMLRSLIIDSILVDMVIFAFALFAKQNIYFYGALIFGVIQYAVIFSSIFMIIFGKSGKGVHDLISYTEVIKEKVIKEF